ncbi:MAG: TA system VapC family ribonuclease toxin [Pirellulaceae bacterium]
MISLPDVNVLLALTWANHVHHDAAHRWFSTASPAGWATNIFTQSGFVRLSLNPKIVGISINANTSLELLKKLVEKPEHRFLDSCPPLTSTPFGELSPRIRGYRQTPDAILLHYARAHMAKLVTFDQGVSSLSPWAENVECLAP